MVLKWGICCVGLVSQDFTSAFLEYKNSSNEIKAVGARSEDRAKIFAERFNIDNYFGTYEDLANFQDIDIVYVGSIHPEHCYLTKLFLNHGKHVLVEKPMAMTVLETKEMIDLAREKGLFLMEGIWSRCFPIYKEMQDAVVNGQIGKLNHVNANIQFNIARVSRVNTKELGGGGLYDVGIYVLQFALWLFKGRKLLNSSGNIKWVNDIDTFGTVTLEFEDNGSAFLSYHTAVNGSTAASAYGDSGSIILAKNMWTPDEYTINGEVKSMKLERKNESFKYCFSNSWNFIYEINHVEDCIKRGLLESDLHSLDESLQLAEIIEKLLK